MASNSVSVAARQPSRWFTASSSKCGNRESWRSLVRREPEQNIVIWAWTAHPTYVRRFLPQWESHRAPGSRPLWVRLRSPRETRRWLDQITLD